MAWRTVVRRRRVALCSGLAGALCAVLGAALAAAPAGVATQASDSGRLLVWINGDKGWKGLQKVGDAFAKKAGVAVQVEHPDDANGKFQQAAGAGRGPDIWCWSHARLGEWVRAGLLKPLSPPKKVRDAIVEEAWSAFQFVGKTWGYPISVESIGLIYNKSLVKTPPKSFDDVARLDKVLAAKGRKAILWDYNNPYFTWPLLAAGGGYVFGRDAAGDFDATKVGVNTPGAVKGAEVVADLIQSGVLSKGTSYARMESAFNKGEIAMMISGPWAWANAKKSNIDFGVAPIPDVAGHFSRPFVDVLGCMISAQSAQPEIARDFLENHVLTLDGLKTINADVPLGTPANRALFRELAENPNIKATMENVRRGEPLPSLPEVARFWPAMAAALDSITAGRQPPKEALDAAAARMQVR
jgi:maltose/maltodextrin transport system substrate-binding protein